MSRSRTHATESSPAPDRGATPWLALALLFTLGLALHARCLFLRFVGDDFILLDAAKRLSFVELLSGRHGIPGFYRPVSRELYFWWWGRVLDFSPAGFHVVNALTWAAAGLLFFLFVRGWLGVRAAGFALAAFLLFPPAGALLSWVSCAQDLIAVFWCAFALLLYQRGRARLAAVAVALAALSKETALPLVLVLAAYDWSATPDATPRERLARLRWPLAGFALGLAVAMIARATWPAGRSIAVWSPRQIVDAWRIPGQLMQSLAPPHTLQGIVAAWREVPLGLALPALLALAAAFAIPSRKRAPAPPARGAFAFGLAATLLGALPVAVIVERWRGYYFSIAALGLSLLAALLLRRLPRWLSGLVLAAFAIVSYGSNTVYRPLATGEGPGRHAHANYAFFREGAAVTGEMLATLEPWCDSLRTVQRAFVLNLPPGVLFDTVIGPALRVTCRDTSERVRRVEAFRAADASLPMALLRFVPEDLVFRFQRAGARGRIELGDSLRAMGREWDASACFIAARALGDSSRSFQVTVGPHGGDARPSRPR